MSTIQRTNKITPCLWFDGTAEQAANFYVSLFKNSKIGDVSRYGDAGSDVSGQPEGSVMTVEFEIDGQEFMGLNGGPLFKFTEAVSFVINCDSQEEVDRFWEKLTANGGAESQCGWLKDKYGLSWQVVPTVLNELLKDKDRAKAERVMKAMLQMKKIDIATLKKAAEGASAASGA
jgi:predicted 3-demethylubiquinone-9 3-methyltransferase (glyoxalase superfamily)